MLQTKNRLNLMEQENLTLKTNASFGSIIKSCFLFAFLAIAGYTNAQSCPLVCNNLVQVSLDDDCKVEITPDMMLEGQGTDPLCTYSVTVMGSANGLPIPGSPFVTSSHIDKTLTVKISLGQNSCWGQIKVEDKLGPKIVCPSHLTITCYDTVKFVLPTATDNCSSATVKLLSNDLDDNGCGEDYTAVRTLTYQATDLKGNKSPLCIRYVYYQAVDFEDLEFPLNRDDVESPALECDNVSPKWDLNNNGYPEPNETGAPTIGGYPIFPNLILCETNATFTDQKLVICANSFKVLRKWTVLNWCTGEIEEDFQVIKVVDKRGPIITCPMDKKSPFDPAVSVADVLTSDPYTCSTSWKVIPPLVIFDCGKTTYTVDYLEADANGNPPVNGVYISDNVVKNADTTYTIKNLKVGRTWIRYKVTDACGNFTYCFTEVDVVDNVPPVAVCDEFTVVTLTTGGVAQIFSESFDDGSHDNCTSVTLDSRRMTPGCGESTINWTKAVKFCCEDVGKDVMVSLRVTDKNNNSNTCMVIVRVQDKIDPTIVCPKAITINCDQDKENLDLVGRPVASDNCFASTPMKSDAGSLNQCGLGIFTRTWTTKDNNVPARTATCTQRIEVKNNSPFKGTDINWSAVSGTKTLNGCIDIDTDPSKTGKPTWTSDACDLIASTYTDQMFTIVDSACFKILRTWTVIDWCSFDQNNPNAGGMWQFTQIIKLNNTVKPVFDACPSDITVCAYGEKCDGFVELKKAATDDCTPTKDLVWTWSLDLGNNNTTDKTGKNTDASGTYPVGTHKITWTVEDKCGNKATCVQTILIKDCKKPTPYCLSEVTTVVMPVVNSIDIWATDFDKGSFDNCPGTLKLSFSENVTDIKRTFNCSNLGINNLQMWVTDAAGNKEFCNVKVNIQSNPGGCTTTNQNVIAGTVSTDKNRNVENVTVSLISNETMLAKTDANGAFNFQGMPNKDYAISAENNENYLNGVSTLDLVMIQRHILGTQKITSAYNIIAADVNADAKLSASDLVELRKLILGIYSKLPNNKSWRFVDSKATFTDPAKPWPFTEKVNVTYNGTSINGANLKAIKIGDINESATVNAKDNKVEPRTNKVLKLEIAQQAFENGNKIIVPIYAGDVAELSGLQFTMKYNNEALKIIGVVPGVINITDEDVNISGNSLAAAFASKESIKVNKNEELFALVFESINTGTINQSISLTSDIVNSEAYTSDLEVMKVSLSYRNVEAVSGVSLMQNVPNPFQTTTTIQFILPEAQNATLKIFDITGKTVYAKEGNYTKGINSIVLNSDQLGAGGVLYYQLETKGYTSTKKMIMMNK